MTKITWICLDGTYNHRKGNLPLGVNVSFDDPGDYTVVEATRLRGKVIDTVLKHNAIYFSEFLSYDETNYPYVYFLARQGLPCFYRMEDLVYYIQTMEKIKKNGLESVLGNHSKHVARISKNIAMALYNNTDIANQMYQAGLLHDVGKLKLPYSFINADRRFNRIEKKYAELHVLYSICLLEDKSINGACKEVAIRHHERLDGSGYMQGIKDREISLSVRIVSVADVFSALTEERPYRTGCDVELAIGYIKSKTPECFDSEVVKALVYSISSSAAK